MTTPVPQAVADHIRNMIAAEMKPLPVDRFEVRCAPDTDGDDAVFIDVWHPLSTTPITGRQLVDVQFNARQILLDAGDERFPYVRQHFADGQAFARAA